MASTHLRSLKPYGLRLTAKIAWFLLTQPSQENPYSAIGTQRNRERFRKAGTKAHPDTALPFLAQRFPVQARHKPLMSKPSCRGNRLVYLTESRYRRHPAVHRTDGTFLIC